MISTVIEVSVLCCTQKVICDVISLLMPLNLGGWEVSL